MSVESPSWAQMLGRLAAIGFRNARGIVRYDIPTGNGSAEQGSCEFWFAAPNRWRVEDDAGVLHVQGGEWLYVRDRDGRMQRLPLATTSWHFDTNHPWTLVGRPDERLRRFTDPNDFSIPMGPGVPVEVAGRRCWEFTLTPPPRKPHPLRLALDDLTGTVLRMAVPELGSIVVAERIETDVEVADDMFFWTEPYATTWLDERTHWRRTREWLEQQQLPVPRWWPTGVAYSPMQGDPDTGAFSVSLMVPGDPDLARWPVGGVPPQYWSERAERRHVHQWSDGAWQWALAVDEPLTEDDLAQVKGSISAH